MTPRLSAILLSIVVVLGAAADAAAQRAIVLVRHAEKLDASDDTVLSAAGVTRAEALAELLRDAGVTAIVTTEYRRTKATAAPLAARVKLVAEVIPARQLDALVERLARAPADAVIVVVGHTNTLPVLLARLGWKGSLTLNEPDFNNVFIVVPRAGAEPSVVRLKYGQPSAP